MRVRPRNPFHPLTLLVAAIIRLIICRLLSRGRRSSSIVRRVTHRVYMFACIRIYVHTPRIDVCGRVNVPNPVQFAFPPLSALVPVKDCS